MKQTLTLASCLIMTALLHAQTTIFVKPDGTGDGTSWATACDLEKAVADASAPLSDRTEIWVQKGTYYPTKMLVIQDSVKIYGGFFGIETALSQRDFVANPTIVDAQQKFGSVFRLENAAVIDGFTIQNGNAQGNPYKNGGGVWANENTIIENCIIKNNTAMLNGGGVYAKGKVEIINSTIKGNTANGDGNNTFGNCLELDIKQSAMNSGFNIAGCNGNIPDLGEISFTSDKITTISINGVHQEWSDEVMATGCNKTYYQGGVPGNYYTDCRANSNRSAYGDLFSWCAVERFAHLLCPSPWRMPTKDDYAALNSALGGNGVASLANHVGTGNNQWNGTYLGRCNGSGTLELQQKYAYYWARLEASSTCGYNLGLYPHISAVAINNGHDKYYGMALRCVR